MGGLGLGVKLATLRRSGEPGPVGPTALGRRAGGASTLWCPVTADAFSTLGLGPCFDLDDAAVESAYLARAARLHPDVARGDPEAPARAAALNEARRVLLDPESRAHALLARLGVPPVPDRSLPPGFLEEILGVRMRAEEEIAAEGAAARERWREWARERRRGHLAAAAERFGRLPARPGAADLSPLRAELNAWRYIERMMEQLDPPEG